MTAACAYDSNQWLAKERKMLSVAEPEFCVNSMNMDPFCLAEDEVSGIKYGGIKAIYYT